MTPKKKIRATHSTDFSYINPVSIDELRSSSGQSRTILYLKGESEQITAFQASVPMSIMDSRGEKRNLEASDWLLDFGTYQIVKTDTVIKKLYRKSTKK